MTNTLVMTFFYFNKYILQQNYLDISPFSSTHDFIFWYNSYATFTGHSFFYQYDVHSGVPNRTVIFTKTCLIFLDINIRG